MKKRNPFITYGVTTITRAVIYAVALGVFSVCAILLPELGREEAAGKTNPPLFWPFLVGAWILSIPVFISLYQVTKVLQYMDENRAFSNLSVKALQIIKICAVVFSVLIATSAIALVVVGKLFYPTEDMPPIIMLGTIVTFTSSVIATFVAVLQKLLKNAIDMKTENDLTV